MVTIIDILAELEKVSLEPLLIPVLKASDPLMGSLPKGSLKTMLESKGTQDGLVKTVEGMAPLFPALIRYAGHLAESKLALSFISSMCIIVAAIMKPFNPLMAKLLVPSIGPMLKLTNAMMPIIPPMIKVSDSFLRKEIAAENVFRGSKSQ